MDPAILAAIFAGVGAAGLLAQIVRFIFKRIDGSAARELKQNTSLETQRATAIRERDQSDAKRRLALDYAARLRREVIALGGEPELEPDFDHTIPRAELRKLLSQPKEKP